jgi:hypothetical protein
LPAQQLFALLGAWACKRTHSISLNAGVWVAVYWRYHSDSSGLWLLLCPLALFEWSRSQGFQGIREMRGRTAEESKVL